jgi:hypothetical protein
VVVVVVVAGGGWWWLGKEIDFDYRVTTRLSYY